MVSRDLPPGPPLPVAVQTAIALLAPGRFARACQRRYGDSFTLRLAGFGTEVHLADPADIRPVFRGDPGRFHAGEANAVLTPIVGPDSVFVLDGHAHRRVRGMLTPAFHGDVVRRQAERIERITRAHVATWPVGASFAALPRLQRITLDVMLRTVIGVSGGTRLLTLRRALRPMVEVGSPLWLFPPPGVLGRIGPWRYQTRVRAHARRLLFDEIALARAEAGSEDRDDILSTLVTVTDDAGKGLTDGELCDQLVTLLLAGHETTAIGLAWTLERLTRDRTLLARTITAADEDDEAFLDAVCKESLRIRPVVGEIGRVLTETTEVAGHQLPKGTMVVPTIHLVHRSPSVHEDPEDFRPDRFDHPMDHAAWLPFGGGVRRCIGAGFALLEMRAVLRTLLREVEFLPTDAPAEPARARHVTLVPARGAMVTVAARRG